MKVLPINSNNQIQYKARFPKKELDILVQDIQQVKASDNIQALYTMLELLDKQGGKKASILCRKPNGYASLDEYQKWDMLALTVDKKIIQEEVTFPSNILYRGVTNMEIHNGSYYRMPVSIFDQKVLQNSDKTLKDIEKFALEE